jgi:hypothetical protein
MYNFLEKDLMKKCNIMKVILRCIILICLIPTSIIAQTDESGTDKFFTLSGAISFSFETYNYDTLNYNTHPFRPKYQDNLMGVSANLNIKLGKYFSIPIGMNLSNQDIAYNLPTVPDENLIDYVKNPRNNIHIDPTYKWVKMYFGSHTPRYSELTTGDIQIFGAGLDLNPGRFILSANYGISQYAIEPDIFINSQGAYKQDIIAGRIGIGKSSGSKFTLNFVKVKDDIYSIVSQPINIDPIEGVTISPLIETKIGKRISLKTETSVSIFTQNQLSESGPSQEYIPELLSDVISVNFSSKADLAHVSSLGWEGKSFSLSGEVKYIGPGFMPAGYRFMEKDFIDYKINSGVRLFKSKVNLNGTFGVRTNNIKSTNLESTKRIIANTNLMLQVNKAINININYSNFGMSNDQSMSNIRIKLIQNSFSFSPSYQFKTEAANHVISANISKNEFQQFNAIANDFLNTNSENYIANYITTFNTLPLNLGFSALLLTNASSVGTLNMMNYQFLTSYKFFDKKLEPALSLTLANVKMGEYTADNRLSAKLKMQYRVNKKLNVRFSYSFKKYNYGSSKAEAILKENKLQCSLSMKF